MVVRQLTVAQQEIAEALDDMRAERGESIVYQRGSEFRITIRKAVRGSTVWDSDKITQQNRIADRSIDWLIDVKDLRTITGEEIEPQREDEIQVSETGEVFRVIPRTGKPAWQWVDRSGQTVRRIFTKDRSL